MKNNLIISIIILAIGAMITGCTNKEAKAQALLVEAISYSEGTPPEAGQQKALKLAETTGFKPGTDGSGLTVREVVMVGSRLLVDQILTQYPSSQAAIKAAEMRIQINQRLQAIANDRAHSQFNYN